MYIYVTYNRQIQFFFIKSVENYTPKCRIRLWVLFLVSNYEVFISLINTYILCNSVQFIIILTFFTKKV